MLEQKDLRVWIAANAALGEAHLYFTTDPRATGKREPVRAGKYTMARISFLTNIPDHFGDTGNPRNRRPEYIFSKTFDIAKCLQNVARNAFSSDLPFRLAKFS